MYDWWVLVHIVGVLGFMFTHRVSGAMALRLRHERDPDKIRILLQVSSSSTGLFYLSIVILLAGGIVAGFQGHWWGQGWIWTALAVLLATMAFMYALAAPYYKRIRTVMKMEDAGSVAVGQEEIDAVMRSGHPLLIVWVGILSLAFIAYLMVLKPY